MIFEQSTGYVINDCGEVLLRDGSWGWTETEPDSMWVAMPDSEDKLPRFFKSVEDAEAETGEKLAAVLVAGCPDYYFKSRAT